MKAEILGCTIMYIRNYHYSLSDNLEETSSHHVWVSLNDYVFVIIFVKTGKIIPQLNHKHNWKVTWSVELLCFHIRQIRECSFSRTIPVPMKLHVQSVDRYCLQELLYQRQM